MNKKGERERRAPIHPTTLERRDRDGLELRSASHTTTVVSNRTWYWHVVVEIRQQARIARRNRRGSRPEGFEVGTSFSEKDLR